MVEECSEEVGVRPSLCEYAITWLWVRAGGYYIGYVSS